VQGGDAAKGEARDALISEYQGYVGVVVSKLMRAMSLPPPLREDFMAAGLLGLVEAADRFDPGKGTDFRAFAFFRIRGAVIDHIRDGCELSGQAYRMFKALEAAHELQTDNVERAAVSPKPSGDRMGHVLEYLSKSAVAYKLAMFCKHDESAPDDPEAKLSRKQESEKIRVLVATLPEKERTIIEQYYFNDRKFIEVAEQYAGLSKSWVSRLHDRALALLRDRYLEATAEVCP